MLWPCNTKYGASSCTVNEILDLLRKTEIARIRHSCESRRSALSGRGQSTLYTEHAVTRISGTVQYLCDQVEKNNIGGLGLSCAVQVRCENILHSAQSPMSPLKSGRLM